MISKQQRHVKQTTLYVLLASFIVASSICVVPQTVRAERAFPSMFDIWRPDDGKRGYEPVVDEEVFDIHLSSTSSSVQGSKTDYFIANPRVTGTQNNFVLPFNALINKDGDLCVGKAGISLSFQLMNGDSLVSDEQDIVMAYNKDGKEHKIPVIYNDKTQEYSFTLNQDILAKSDSIAASDISVKVLQEDKELIATTLDKLFATDNTPLHNIVFTQDENSQAQLSMLVEQDGKKVNPSEDNIYYVNSTNVNVSPVIADNQFTILRDASKITAPTVSSSTDASISSAASITSYKQSEDKTWTSNTKQSVSLPHDGSYSFNAQYARPQSTYYGFEDTTALKTKNDNADKAQGLTYEFALVVDTQAPTIDDIEVVHKENEKTYAFDAPEMLVGKQRIIRFKLHDTGEINADEVTVSVKYAQELNGKDKKEETLKATATDDGYYEVTLSQEGIYSLQDIVISAEDKAHNKVELSLATHKKQDLSFTCPDYIVVDTQLGSKLHLDVTAAKATPATNHKGYYRGNVDITLTASSKYFGYWLKTREAYGQNFITDQGNASLEAVSDWKQTDKGWQSTWRLPGGNKPQEGEHKLIASYKQNDIDYTSDEQRFIVDYTAPTASYLTSSVISPIQRNIVFAPKSVDLRLTIADNVSAIDTDASELVLSGNDVENITPSWNKDSVSFTMDRNNQRLVLANSHIHLQDMAGNETEDIALSKFVDAQESNLPRATAQIIINSAQPHISIHYDNNDVHNGRYYNKNRQATIVLQDSAFDLVKEFDPDRVVARFVKNGQTFEIHARDMQHISGDTYQAYFTCVDGQWTVDASYTSISGIPAEAVHHDFVVDTQAPVIYVSFDNNKATNGYYYQANRRACIQVFEQNFTPATSYVTTRESNAYGHTFAGPSMTGWVAQATSLLNPFASTQPFSMFNVFANKGLPQWHTFVNFDHDNTYALGVEVTDLAGNTAKLENTEAFTIDTHAPELEINNVDNGGAYAKEVMPQIHAHDDNIAHNDIEYTLTTVNGASVDGVTAATTQSSDFDTNVDFSDFKHGVSADNIYTLHASTKDMAGNTVEVEKTFAVDRFGSYYKLVGDTANVPGSYLRSPKDLTIAEINVAGLNHQNTVVQVAYDSSVKTLGVNDYQIREDTENGWPKTTYTLPSRLFAHDGYYRIMLKSVDNAGNLAQNTMQNKDETRTHDVAINFALDTTRPVAHVADLDANKVYFGLNHKIYLNASDNLALEHAKLIVDDKEVASWSEDDLTSSVSYLLPSDAKEHTISFVATDKAGNTRVETYNNVAVAQDWLAFLLANPLALYLCVAVAVLLLSAVVAAVVYFVHRKKTKCA